MVPTRAEHVEYDEYNARVSAYVAAGADESVQRVVTAVRRLSRRLDQWFDAQLAELDVSTSEWTVLTTLARAHGGAMTPSQLADAAAVAPSSMTGRLDRMVERELVTREHDPDNRTRVLVRLTPTGRDLHAKAIRESNVVEADVLSSLSPAQQERLADFLESMIKHVDEALD